MTDGVDSAIDNAGGTENAPPPGLPLETERLGQLVTWVESEIETMVSNLAVALAKAAAGYTGASRVRKMSAVYIETCQSLMKAMSGSPLGAALANGFVDTFSERLAAAKNAFRRAEFADVHTMGSVCADCVDGYPSPHVDARDVTFCGGHWHKESEDTDAAAFCDVCNQEDSPT